MQELVTTEQATHVLRLLAVALPLLGLAVGLLLRWRGRRVTGIVVGALLVAGGPGLLGLWAMYNGIMGRYGLDSVKGLLINLVLFAGVGLMIGLGVGWARRRLAAPTAEAGSDT